ncbi:MAG: hypothetical protein AAGF30_16655, partial [Pseudomonadota bacterium]
MTSFNQGQYDRRGTISDNHSNWPILRVTGSDGTVMELQDAFAPTTDGGWSTFSADVNADAGWTINGEAASAEQMEAVLASVETSEIRIEQAYGNQEIIGLDNVSFRSGR